MVFLSTSGSACNRALGRISNSSSPSGPKSRGVNRSGSCFARFPIHSGCPSRESRRRVKTWYMRFRLISSVGIKNRLDGLDLFHLNLRVHLIERACLASWNRLDRTTQGESSSRRDTARVYTDSARSVSVGCQGTADQYPTRSGGEHKLFQPGVSLKSSSRCSACYSLTVPTKRYRVESVSRRRAIRSWRSTGSRIVRYPSLWGSWWRPLWYGGYWRCCSWCIGFKASSDSKYDSSCTHQSDRCDFDVYELHPMCRKYILT